MRPSTPTDIISGSVSRSSVLTDGGSTITVGMTMVLVVVVSNVLEVVRSIGLSSWVVDVEVTLVVRIVSIRVVLATMVEVGLTMAEVGVGVVTVEGS